MRISKITEAEIPAWAQLMALVHRMFEIEFERIKAGSYESATVAMLAKIDEFMLDSLGLPKDENPSGMMSYGGPDDYCRDYWTGLQAEMGEMESEEERRTAAESIIREILAHIADRRASIARN